MSLNPPPWKVDQGERLAALKQIKDARNRELNEDKDLDAYLRDQSVGGLFAPSEEPQPE